MFFYIMFALVAGIFIGTLTGLIPGVHPNTVFVFMVSLVSMLPITPEMSFVFIVSLAVSNTFTDFLPSVIFGAPDPATALSVLPGHRMMLEGRGYEALFLTVVGGLGSVALTILALPLIFLLLPVIYETISPVMHFVLLSVLVWMVAGEKRRTAAAAVILLSGVFGFVSLGTVSGASLFPAFTGLFAVSTIITSIRQRSVIPPQEHTREVAGPFRKGIITGWLAGWFSGILPGIGAAQAGVMASQALRAKSRDFLTALGGINTSNIVFTIIMLYLLEKTRSGAAQAISSIIETLSPGHLVMMIGVVVASGCISAGITIGMGRAMMSSLHRIEYAKLNAITLIFLLVLVSCFSGLAGLLITFTGACIGIFTISQGVRRSHLMGFLMVPTILYFSSAGVYMNMIMGL